jgi:hypothetical protein
MVSVDKPRRETASPATHTTERVLKAQIEEEDTL